MPSKSMKILMKALLNTLVLVGLLVAALAAVLIFTKTWPSEMKALFDTYIFPALIFLIGGIGLVNFIKISIEKN